MAKKFLSTLQQQAIWMLGIDGTQAVTPKNVRSAIFRGIGLDDTGRLAKDQLRTGDRRTLQPGRCYLFDGVNDYVAKLGGMAFTYPLTLCAWVQWTSGIGSVISLAKNADAINYTTLQVNASGVPILVRRTNASGSPVVHTSTATLTSGTWAHVAVIINSATEASFFVNGVAAGSTTGASVLISASDSILLGLLRNSSPAEHWNGKLFDVRIYDTALTAAQIAAIHAKNEETQNYPTPVAWYKCDDNHTSTAYDSSGNDRHGTKTNISTGTFHATGKDVPRSFPNDYGFTDASGNLVPRDESTPTQDVLGNDLQYSGQAPRDAKLIKSHCTTFDGVNDRIDVPSSSITNQGRTYLFWMKSSLPGGTKSIFCEADSGDSSFAFISNGKLMFRRSDTNLQYFNGAGVLFDTAWHYVQIYIPPDTDLALHSAATPLSLKIDGTTIPLDTTGQTYNATFTSPTGQTVTLGTGIYGAIAAQFMRFTCVPGIVSEETLAKWINGEDIAAQFALPLSEGAGTTAFDVSGNNRHGTVKNANLATFWGTTQDNYHRNIASGFDHVLEFDGVDDQVVTTLTTPHPTLAGWFFVPAGTSQTVGQYMFAKAGVGGIAFGHGTAEYRGGFFYIGGSIHGPGPITLPTGRWFHYLLTFTGTQILAYLDGVLVGSKAVTGSLATNANAWVVNGEGSVARMPGRMRDVRIYNQAVSASDAAILAAGDEIGLSPVLHLPLNEGSGTTAFDQAGSNNGTITGATWTKQPASTKNVSLVGSNLPVDRPAGSWHNGAETHIDFTNGEPNQPWTNELTVPTDYAYGDSLTPPVEKKVNPKTESEFYFFNP